MLQSLGHICDHIRVMLTDLRHDPSDGLSYLGMLIIKHSDEVWQPGPDHLHELHLARSLSDGT